MNNTTYRIKGFDIKERQLFIRSYSVQGEPRKATYFIDGGRAYSVSADDGKAGRCNFNAGFLNSGHTKAIEPLDEFYEGRV
jgi:hypothetical protein